MRHLAAATRAAAAALLLSSTLAHAYVVATDRAGRPLRWNARSIQLLVAPASGTLGPALREATEHAAERWCAATDLSIVVHTDPRAPLQVSEDGRNSVVLRTHRWCPDDPAQPCYDPSRHALTELHTRSLPNQPQAAEIVEADIEVNAVDFDWRALPQGSLDAVLLHELGHLLGLEHSCGASLLLGRTDQRGAPVPICADASATALGSVMYPDPLDGSHGGRVELSEDDRTAGAELYAKVSGAHSLTLPTILAVLGLGTVSALWLARNRHPSGSPLA